MSTYALSLHNLHFGLLSHSWQQPLFVRDGHTHRHEELDVFVKSGDYFTQLATTLDTLYGGDLSDSQYSSVLNRIILDLLYLQAHYEIKKRS